MLGGFAFDYVAGVFSTSMVSINWSGDLLHGLDYTSVFFYPPERENALTTYVQTYGGLSNSFVITLPGALR